VNIFVADLLWILSLHCLVLSVFSLLCSPPAFVHFSALFAPVIFSFSIASLAFLSILHQPSRSPPPPPSICLILILPLSLPPSFLPHTFRNPSFSSSYLSNPLLPFPSLFSSQIPIFFLPLRLPLIIHYHIQVLYSPFDESEWRVTSKGGAYAILRRVGGFLDRGFKHIRKHCGFPNLAGALAILIAGGGFARAAGPDARGWWHSVGRGTGTES